MIGASGYFRVVWHRLADDPPAMRSIPLLAPFLSLFAAAAASAEPCGLDATFRDGGVAHDPAPQALGKFDAVARDPRGGYLAAGEGDTGESPYFTVVFVARYLRDGSLDAGYGNGGFARWQETPEDGAPDNASLSKVDDVAAAPDGSALVLGYQVLTTDAVDIQLWRFTSAGAIDTGFGDAGVAHLQCGATPFDASDYALPRLLLDESGRAVVTTQRGTRVVVMRVRSDGAPDPAFGSESPGCSTFDRQVRQPAGVVRRGAGYELAGGRDGQVWTLRIDAAGAPDATYGTAGLVTTTAPAVHFVSAIALQGDRLVLGAESGDDLAAVRLTTAGALDASFAGGGVRAVPMPDEPSDQEFAQDLAVAEDGRIAVAGLYDTFDEPGELLVALMDADGQDPAAGCDAGNRVAVSAQKGADARGFGVAFDGDRVVLVGGASERGYQRDETAIAVLAPGVLFRNGFD